MADDTTPVQTYTHYEAEKLNATRFVTLGDYHRLRERARDMVEAYEDFVHGSGIRLVTLEPTIDALRAEATRPTV